MTDHKKLVADIARLQADRDEIDEAIEFKKAKLAEELPKGENLIGDNESGWVKVIVYQHKTFNAAFGRKNVTSDVWDKVYEAAPKVPNATTAKAVLSADEYALFQKPSDKLSVKLEVIND